MTQTDKLHFLIDRFDHYYDSINSKGNAMLVIHKLSIGGFLTFYTFLYEKIEWSWFLKLLIAIVIILWGLSLFYTTYALMPYQKSAKDSLIFFGSIGQLQESEYVKKVSLQNDKEYNEDLAKQSYYLACGLRQKFARLKVASKCLHLSYPFLFITIFFTIIYLK